MELLYKEEVFSIIGSAIEVHRELGAGFLEAVYQEAFEIELRARNIPLESRKHLHLSYKGEQLQKEYVADLVIYDKIVVELKALERLSGAEESQIINYLKATGLRVGVLINFGAVAKLEWKRFIK